MKIRERLNRVIEPLGFRVEKVNRFDRHFAKLLRQRGSFKFVQVGVHDGVLFDGLYAWVTAHQLPRLAKPGDPPALPGWQ